MTPQIAPLTATFAVYLLHFEHPVDGQRHYVGITTPRRLDARMREHLTGRGAKLTKAAKIAGSGFALARVFPSENPQDEHFWATHPELDRYCPTCANGTRIRTYRAQPFPARKDHPVRSFASL